VRAGVAAAHIDLAASTVSAHGDTIHYRILIGADGSESRVRRVLGVRSPRAYFACEYNVPCARLEPLRVECDPVELAAGYRWVFPHAEYTSVGCGAPKAQVAPRVLRSILDRHMRELGFAPDSATFEGATIEVHHPGTEFPNGVFLVGDAAGLPSPLTAEGNYPALVSGEEVARRILEPGYQMPRLRRWLKVKRQHHRLSAMLASPTVRQGLLPVFARLGQMPRARRALADFYLAG
jgi:flavin-dependent dehydrogenase